MNRSRSVVRTGVALAVGVALSATARAQPTGAANPALARDSAERAAVEITAMQYVVRDAGAQGDLELDRTRGIVFDRRVTRANTTAGDRPTRSEAQARRLAHILGVPLVDGDSVLKCTGDDPRCQGLPDCSTLVSVGPTTVDGDSASTSVTALFPPSATRPNTRYYHRLELVLHRVRGRWQVVPTAGRFVRS